jgi:hypothetical protein
MMTRKEFEAICFTAGSAEDYDVAEKLAIEIIRNGLALVDNIRANREKYPNGKIRAHLPGSYNSETQQFEWGDVDPKFSDVTCKLTSDIESLAYRLRIDAGIWPSDHKFKKEG